MPPPSQKPFFCTLCQKGYSRVHEFEAHENSYDHQHKKRFQEMKAMQRSHGASAPKPVPVKMEMRTVGGGGRGGGGFKKAGFKSAFGGGGEVKISGMDGRGEEGTGAGMEAEEEESDDGECWGGYDPARPTGPD